MYVKKPCSFSNVSNWLLCAAALSLLPLAASGQRIIDFGDLSLSPDSYYNGSDEAGGFSSGGAFFNNDYNTEYSSWSGWSYSNINDTETAGWENQYASITGSGIGPTGVYGIGYSGGAAPRIVLPENESFAGIQVTNTTYAYLSMRDGDPFSKQFQSADDDFFRLTITGLDAAEAPIDSIDVYLADFRHADSSLDYILDTWTWVDLSGFGANVRMIEFGFASSDVSEIWGMNTPAYFALGEVAVVPEPATFALWGGLAAGFVILIRRRTIMTTSAHRREFD